MSDDRHGPAFTLGQAPVASRFVLRGDAAMAARAGTIFGVALPLQPCQSNSQAGRAAIWLGPDEWLLHIEGTAPAGTAGDLARSFAVDLADMPHSLVDVSDRQLGVLASGDRAARVLSAGCPLDLHSAAYPPGMATRTVLGRIEVVLWRRGAAVWHIEVARSFAGYAMAFLTEAARGLPHG